MPSQNNLVFTLKTKQSTSLEKSNVSLKIAHLTCCLRAITVTWGVCLLFPDFLHNSQLTRNMSYFYTQILQLPRISKSMSTTGLNGSIIVTGKTAQATTAIMYSQMGDLSLIILAGGEGTLSTCFTRLVSTATHPSVWLMLQSLYSLCTLTHLSSMF